MSGKAARIRDVALAAGVSTATVSRALSNPDLLSEATRNQVFDAIRQTGYRVNRAARNLRTQRAGAVLVLVPNLGNPFFSRILAGISAGFANSDQSVLIADTAGHPEKGRAFVEYFRDCRVDGMISLDGSLSEDDLSLFASNGAGDRIVFACEWVQGAAFPSVRSDNEMGARLAVRHLHDLGHSDIAHVTGPAGSVLTRARREGMLDERDRLGLPSRSDCIIRGDFSIDSGREAARRIIAMKNRPTAVFCASDMVAFGLIATLADAGISVPGDISVVGFDDIEMSGYYIPALTTIRQDRHGLGLRAAQLLIDRLEGPEGTVPADHAELIDVTLIERDSTAPPGQRP
ncbi:LacI family DNA-binding transcriptional regulator [Paracoccus sp. 1_MG-2023]|uniref:LacI family DNA-binding transcriptional regulator n=1 Tax=unclassified Paracoccus (in: a-proteobacteria) TaxID=2688777 RepID=UPI001C08A3F0|nr:MULTISPECIES: LacI family DNA-binding transcriptional regulator [unclassified Paracoccus (in: a-proteobacteria)]MBU2957976.1 LacI family transcriptional regulator [Paracoccus sp. C2R09]MDO6668830.1 LacI family DNA-binding transcriptional regulator [Paracoccus sp. 1_MG-2023]